MANQNDISPAVRSLQNEQGDRERRGTDSDLDKALEDTFPASDPVAVSSTTGDNRSSRSYRRPSASSDVKGSLDGYLADIEGRIREKPLAAAAIVAGLAWLYGRTR
ncbi:hypothetical protein C8J34_10651 [Rhizobium sp. PP-F2F-G36]|nr:hypothetical protein C8J34_10651 [Rhizobium sp. PP-F2F-G36]